MDMGDLQRLLAEQRVDVDDETLAAVARWHEAWRQEWRHVEAMAIDDEEMPAPLWAWPP